MKQFNYAISVRSLVILLWGIFAFSCTTQNNEVQHALELKIVPTPNKILTREGVVSLGDELWVIVDVSDSSSSRVGSILVERLEKLTNKPVLITDLFSTRKHKYSIELKIGQEKNKPDGYSLDLTSNQFKLESGNIPGLMYGAETLLQILKHYQSKEQFIIPRMVIKDFPVRKTRGVILNQNQLTGDRAEKVLKKMNALKLNSIYIQNNSGISKDILSLANKDNISILSLSTPPTERLEFSLSNENNKLRSFQFTGETFDAVILDLSKTSTPNLNLQLRIVAEVAWSFNNIKDEEHLIQYILAYTSNE